MYKIFYCCFLVSALAVLAFAEDLSWLPGNLDETSSRCNKKLNLPSNFVFELSDNPHVNKTQRNAVLLCRLKEANMYKDATGFDVEKWNLVFKPTKREEKCERPVVPECIQQFRNVTPEGEKVFQTVKCITDMEVEKIEMGCGF